MSEIDPYKSPSADVTVAQAADLQLHEPVRQSAGAGISWISDAFRIFGSKPGLWIAAAVVYLVIMAVISIVPIVSIFSGIVTPVLTAGFIYACYKVDTGQGMEVVDIFEGFQRNVGNLLLVGLISFIFSLLLMGAIFLLGISLGLSLTPNEQGQINFEFIIILVLLFLALLLPIIMMVWFAPALVILNNVGAWQAMVMSFKGCLKNIIPFILYGIVMLVLLFAAMIPLLLGLIVLVPVMFASVYTSYKSIYIQ